MARNANTVTCHGARREGNTDRSSPMNHTDQPEKAEPSLSPNRHLVEVPDSFAVARWSRDADVATIAHCILGTLKYEPHAVDTTVLRRALEGVIEYPAHGGAVQEQEETTMDAREPIARRMAETCPLRPETPCGKGAGESWPFR